MGLEKLKSVFSNLNKFNQTDVSNMSSEHSIQTEPQEVNNLTNTHAVGFSANQVAGNNSLFVGISGNTWDATTGFYGYTDTNFPGPVNFMSGENSYYATLNPEVPGFTNDFSAGGYTFGASDSGNSFFLGISTGTYIRSPYNASSETVTFSDGSDNKTTQTTHFNDTFTLNFDPSFPGGYSADNAYGDSQISLASTYQSIHIDTETSNQVGGQNQTLSDQLAASGEHIGRVPLTLQNGSTTFTELSDVRALGEGKLTFDTLYNRNPRRGSKDDKYLVNTPGGIIPQNLKLQEAGGSFRGSARIVANIADQLRGNFLFGDNSVELDGREPYITHTIPTGDDYGNISQLNPFNRNAADSLARTMLFLGSTAGILHIVKENLKGIFQRYRPWYTGFLDTLPNSVLPAEGLITPFISVPRGLGLGDGRGATYSDYLEWRNDGGGVWDPGEMNEHIDDAVLNKLNKPFGTIGFEAITSFGGSLETRKQARVRSMGENKDEGNIKPQLNAVNNVNQSLAGGFGKRKVKDWGTIGPLDDLLTTRKLSGDVTTLTPITSDNNQELESSQHGMPFYFKDLRDNTYVAFRAYIEGLNETISPSWNSETYIGRSEPVYTYTNSEREIQFNLKLFAQTKDELDVIYQKMNRLTSLCYPEYTTIKKSLISDVDMDAEGASVYGKSLDKVRMKPPIVQFRLGELFGSVKGGDMTGFIKSLSYTFPDESPWEINEGKRVPKYITADIGFQVIHSEVPSLRFTTPGSGRGVDFYGINSKVGVR